MKFMGGDFINSIKGDPAKAARNIIQVVTGAEVPLRFVVGEDAVKQVKAFYEKRLQELEDARELSTGTNFDA